jgi:hypothetical protein
MEELLYYDAVSSSSYSGTCSSFSSSDLADDSTVFSSYSDFKPLLDINKPELPYTPPFEDSISCDILRLFEVNIIFFGDKLFQFEV